MDNDLNSSINLKNTPKIPRSQTTERKPRDEKLSQSIRNKSHNKSISKRIDILNKNSLDTNIQVHLRVRK